ncbi:hypothetical protein HJFPF1_09961 [Paramyrothecium foliicola]|nr:hypothetical protein HJFPF1_09961 [Paramyrothecium foliicola]
MAKYWDTYLITNPIQQDLTFSKSRHQASSQPLEEDELEQGAFIALKIAKVDSSSSDFIAYFGSIYPAFGLFERTSPTRLLSATSVDWALLRSYLSSCYHQHAGCSSPTVETQIHGFSLIDCHTRMLVPATNRMDYVALSYVWGVPEKDLRMESPEPGDKLSEAPLVIEDAISAVRELGHRYLWVDSYQEELFSSRQLIFGSHQVSFICLQNENFEVYTAPTVLANSTSMQRDLTYDFDALNGIKATLNSFAESTDDPVGTLWGIPFAETIAPLDHDQPSNRAGIPDTTGLLSRADFASDCAIFGYSLSWKMSGNTPRGRQTLRRRKEFPTWSWASCIGHIAFPRLPYLFSDRPVMPDPELDVAMAGPDGLSVPISALMGNADSPELSRYLHMKGWSVRDALTFHLTEGTVLLDLGDADFELSGSLQLDSMPNDDHKEVFTILSETQNSQKRWEAVITWFRPSSDPEVNIPFLLILVVVEDFEHPDRKVYERIGSIPTLNLTRIPKQRRRIDSTGSTARESSRPTVRWAADLIKNQEREEERKQKEWEKTLQRISTVGESDFAKKILARIEEAKQIKLAEGTQVTNVMDQELTVEPVEKPCSAPPVRDTPNAEMPASDLTGSKMVENVGVNADSNNLDETCRSDESDPSSDETDPYDMVGALSSEQGFSDEAQMRLNTLSPFGTTKINIEKLSSKPLSSGQATRFRKPIVAQKVTKLILPVPTSLKMQFETPVSVLLALLPLLASSSPTSIANIETRPVFGERRIEKQHDLSNLTRASIISEEVRGLGKDPAANSTRTLLSKVLQSSEQQHSASVLGGFEAKFVRLDENQSQPNQPLDPVSSDSTMAA